MTNRRDEVRTMVIALMATIASSVRASKKGYAATLSLLHVLATVERARPSDLATALDVHQSTISRQMQSLEEAGLIALTADHVDRRSCFLTLTPKGRKRMQELEEMGLSRFELFVADWSDEEIHTFGHLLAKFEASKARVAEREPQTRTRSWQKKS
jgi:DNA-binding MarR family transcriptional regulator